MKILQHPNDAHRPAPPVEILKTADVRVGEERLVVVMGQYKGASDFFVATYWPDGMKLSCGSTVTTPVRDCADRAFLEYIGGWAIDMWPRPDRAHHRVPLGRPVKASSRPAGEKKETA